ncbi:MAG: hypothetical protein IKD47_06415 [Clostridia bacterium]|nr:hypothetical protein [Clostridia bacterium]
MNKRPTIRIMNGFSYCISRLFAFLIFIALAALTVYVAVYNLNIGLKIREFLFKAVPQLEAVFDKVLGTGKALDNPMLYILALLVLSYLCIAGEARRPGSSNFFWIVGGAAIVAYVFYTEAKTGYGADYVACVKDFTNVELMWNKAAVVFLTQSFVMFMGIPEQRGFIRNVRKFREGYKFYYRLPRFSYWWLMVVATLGAIAGAAYYKPEFELWFLIGATVILWIFLCVHKHAKLALTEYEEEKVAEEKPSFYDELGLYEIDDMDRPRKGERNRD